MPCPLPLSRCLAALGLAVLATHAANAACPKQCVTQSSVVHAAGVPDIKGSLEAIEFDGPQLAAPAQPALQQLAQALKSLPPKVVLQLQVRADDGLSGPAARQQSKARAKALTQALKQAGVPAKSVKVSPQS